MGLLINWIVFLCSWVLLFVALYFVVKAAVRAGTKEALRELGHEVARKVWDEDDQA